MQVAIEKKIEKVRLDMYMPMGPTYQTQLYINRLDLF